MNVMRVPLTAQNGIAFDMATRPEYPSAATAVKTILALSRPRILDGGPGDPNQFPFVILPGTGITGRNKDVPLEVFQLFLDSNKDTKHMVLSPGSGVQVGGKSHNVLQQLEMVFGEKRDAILDALRPGSDEEVEEGGGQAGLFTLLCEKWDETIQEYGIDAKSLVTSTRIDTPDRTSRSPTAAFAAAKTPKTKNSNFFSVTPAKKSASLHSTSFLSMQIYVATSALFWEAKGSLEKVAGPGFDTIERMAIEFDRVLSSAVDIVGLKPCINTHCALGSGSYGDVWLVSCESLVGSKKKFVAVKTFKMDPSHQTATKVEREIRQQVSLSAFPYIATVHEWKITPHFPFIVMDFMDGGTFDKVGQLSEERLKVHLRQLLSCLMLLDAKEQCHRDIKEKNLGLMTDDNGNLNLQLFDFGIGREAKAEIAGTDVGTIGYTAPEVNRHIRKHRESYNGILADMWSSAVAFVKLSLLLEAYEEIVDTWRLVSGFDNALISRKLEEAGYSNDFTNLLTSMLAFDPEKRPSPLQAYEHCAFNGMPSLFDSDLKDWRWIQSILRDRMIKKQQAAEIAELKKAAAADAAAKKQQAAEIAALTERLAAAEAASANTTIVPTNDELPGGPTPKGGRVLELLVEEGGGSGCTEDPKGPPPPVPARDEDSEENRIAAEDAKGSSSPVPIREEETEENRTASNGQDPSSDEPPTVEVLALSEDKITALIHQQRYGPSSTLAGKIRSVHDILSNIESTNYKFLQPYDPLQGPVGLRGELEAKNSGGDSGERRYFAVESCFLVATVNRVRKALLQDFDHARFPLVVSDFIHLFLSHVDYLTNHLLVTKRKPKSVESLIAKAPFVRGLSSLATIDRCVKSKAVSNDSGSDGMVSDAKVIKDAIESALSTYAKSLGVMAMEEIASYTDVENFLAPKCAAHLMGHLTTLGVVLRGMSAVHLSGLGEDIQKQVKALSVVRNETVSDDTSISDICFKLLLPALAIPDDRKTALDILQGVREELGEMTNVFGDAAAKCPIDGDGDDSDNDDDDDDDDDDDEDSDGGGKLTKDKLEGYLIIAFGVLLSGCISEELKERVGFGGDFLELVLRNSYTNLTKSLKMMIWRGVSEKRGSCYIFDDNLSEVQVIKICNHLATLVEGACASNSSAVYTDPTLKLSKKQHKSHEYWNKLVLLPSSPKSVSLVLRVLMLDDANDTSCALAAAAATVPSGPAPPANSTINPRTMAGAGTIADLGTSIGDSSEDGSREEIAKKSLT